MSTRAILDVRDLSVRYHDGTVALHDVSLTIEPGQKVALIGPNGAGKTSLMLAIMNGVHFGGRIEIEGIELTSRTADEARRGCGMIFQDADDQLFMPTLLEDVAFGPLNHGMSPADAQELAKRTIAAVGLAGLEGKAAHHLSGGQKRQAALATVLAMNVRLLLLDEPAANLDFRSRQRLMGMLASRAEAQLLATHDLDLVQKLCSRVVVLDDGHLVADGPVEAILNDRALLAKHGLA